MTTLNFENLHSKQEYLNKLKEGQKELLLNKSNASQKLSGETVTLYHGTTSANLDNILLHGLQPRKFTNNNNFKDSNPSNDDLVYLTSHWHYYYAFLALNTAMQKYEEENNIELEDLKSEEADDMTRYDVYYRLTGDVPIILEVEVPVEWLTYDEDIAYFNQFLDDAQSGKITSPDDIDYKYSMQQHTCASINSIPLSMIKSIKVIAYYDLDYVLDRQSEYGQLYHLWSRGIRIDESKLSESLENAISFMEDYHLGAFDEVNLERSNPITKYEDSCVFVYYK